MKKETSRKKRTEVGPRIVRAWFDTVINPVLLLLDREASLVANRNWTWRFRPGDLESIREVHSYINPEARPNLEQFEALYPDVKQVERQHDKNLSVLRVKCRELHKAVRESEDLAELFRAFTTPEALADLGRGITVKELFGAYPESDNLDLLAEYVVNNITELPAYYSPSPLWNRHKGEFLAILGRPSIRDRYEAAITAGKALGRDTEHLIRLLKDHRFKLSLEYDVPFIEKSVESAGL